MSRSKSRHIKIKGLVVLPLFAVLVGAPASAHDPAFHVAELSERITRQPSRAELYLERGQQYEALRRPDDAVSDFQTALQLDPDLVAASLALADAYLDQGLAEPASLEMEDVLVCHPEIPSAWHLYARALELQGLPAEAIFATSQCLALTSNPQPDTFLRRARLLAELGETHLPAALDSLNEGIDRLGDSITLEMAALDLERRLGRLDDALRRVDRLLANARRQERWLVLKGDVLRDLGRVEEAVDAYRSASAAIAALPARYQDARPVQSMLAEISVGLSSLVDAPMPSSSGTNRPNGGSS